MSSEHFIGFFAGKNFSESVSIVDGLCSRVGRKWKFADFVFNAFFLQLFFGFTNPSNFWVGVDDGRDAVMKQYGQDVFFISNVKTK